LKLIERIKKYQQFFEKLEKKQKFNTRKNALSKLRGAHNIFNAEGELDLTVEDIKMGKKLEQIEQLDFSSRGEEIKEAKLSYYKNMKPKQGVFKISHMDPSQEIIQMAHEKNKKFLTE